MPTFSPEPLVIDQLRTLSDQVRRVVVSDDASPCTSDSTLRTISAIPRTTVIRHRWNSGVGRAFNEGLEQAKQEAARWLLTVDQDSTLTPGYVEQIVSHAETAGALMLGALGAGNVCDASGSLNYPSRPLDGTHLVGTEEVIASGTLWNVEQLLGVGGFDETLGMDAVDAAACLALREQGSVVAIAPELSMAHNLGRARRIHAFGRSMIATGHSTTRQASMVRNRLRLFRREWKQSPKHAIRTIRRAGLNPVLNALPPGTVEQPTQR
jgi:rhamnosyltransferase